MSDYFKTLRESLIDQQKRTDEKQDKVIEQLKENQDKIVKALEYDPQKAKSYSGEPLPEFNYETEEEGPKITEIEEEDEEELPSKTAKKVSYVDLDKGINEEYKSLLKDKGYDLPSEILKNQTNVGPIIQKVKSKIKRSEDYIKDRSTKKGEPLKGLSKIEVTTFKRNKTEMQHFKDYLNKNGTYKGSSKIYGIRCKAAIQATKTKCL